MKRNKINTRIAIVVSQFNHEVTDRLLTGTVDRLNELGFSDRAIKIIKVPGAVEIPLMAKLLARSKKYQAIICLGAVIRGETDHYDHVCQQVSIGCQQVMMEFTIPVIFGVLTTNTTRQALARAGGKHSNKGRYSADAALTMITLTQELA